jgi:hypothetical protein
MTNTGRIVVVTNTSISGELRCTYLQAGEHAVEARADDSGA